MAAEDSVSAECAKLEALGIPKTDSYSILIMTKDLSMSLEVAREALRQKKAEAYCEYCNHKFHDRLEARKRNRHINNHKRKRETPRFGPEAEAEAVTQAHSESSSESSASTSLPHKAASTTKPDLEKSPSNFSASACTPATPPTSTPERRRFESRQHSSSSSSSTTSSSPISTTSTPSSYNPSSSSPKRRADDVSELSSGDDQPGGTSRDELTATQANDAPGAKRLKLLEADTGELITCSATWRKRPGEFSIDRARKYITWHPVDRTTIQPIVIRTVHMISYQQNTGPTTPEEKKGLIQKVVFRESAEMEEMSQCFNFPATEEGRRAARAVLPALKTMMALRDAEKARIADQTAKLMEQEDETYDGVGREPVLQKL